MKADDTTIRLNELERENARLKKVVVDQALDIGRLKEVAGETSVPDPSGGPVALQERLGVSQRRGCCPVDQHRASQRLVANDQLLNSQAAKIRAAPGRDVHNLIDATKTTTALDVRAEREHGSCPAGTRISDSQSGR